METYNKRYPIILDCILENSFKNINDEDLIQFAMEYTEVWEDLIPKHQNTIDVGFLNDLYKNMERWEGFEKSIVGLKIKECLNDAIRDNKKVSEIEDFSQIVDFFHFLDYIIKNNTENP